MYFKDLSPYVYCVDGEEREATIQKNVGWLSIDHPFRTRHCALWPITTFLEKLKRFEEHPVMQTKGFHICELCGGNTSSNELRVMGLDGTVYATPNMIRHYVEVHGYYPPKGFIDAVIYGSAWYDLEITQGENEIGRYHY